MSKFIGVSATVMMDRLLYIEVPEKASDKEILEKAKEEILLPHDALDKIDTTLKQSGIRFSGIDLKDWNLTDVEYLIKK